MTYGLPTSVEINGNDYEIRSDYRAILDILEAINDPELTDSDRAEAVLRIFYPQFEEMPQRDYERAIDRCIWFINCGNEEERPENKPERLMDWQQDFPLIVAPVNRVLGKEIRSLDYLHWWTFIGAYQEIGDCTFAQIVNIRQKKAHGKKLDKAEQEYYKKNRHLIDFKRQYTSQEEDVISRWI